MTFDIKGINREVSLYHGGHDQCSLRYFGAGNFSEIFSNSGLDFTEITKTYAKDPGRDIVEAEVA